MHLQQAVVDIVMLMTCFAAAALEPVVSNVTFVQQSSPSGGTVVLINYDLEAPNGPCDITVSLSKDAGADGFVFPVTRVTGDLEAVSTGTGHIIRWDIAAEYPNETMPEATLMITAQEGPGSYEDDLATIPARAARHGYPRIAVQCQRTWEGDAHIAYEGRECFRRLYWYDFAIVDGNAVANDHTFEPEEHLYNYLGRNGSIRAKNPDFVAVAYFSPADFIDAGSIEAEGNAGENIAIENIVRWNKVLYTYAYGPTWDPWDHNGDGKYDTGPDDNFDADNWLMHTDTGEEIHVYPFGSGIFSRLQDPAKAGMRERFVQTYNDLVVSREVIDGIYFDWAYPIAPNVEMGLPDPPRYHVDIDGDGESDVCGEDPPEERCVYELQDEVNVYWREGLLALFARCQAVFPDGFLMTGNSGWYNEPAYLQQLHGTNLEGFNKAVVSGALHWGESMYTYAAYAEDGRAPRFSMLMSEIPLPAGQLETNENMLFDRMRAGGGVFWSSDQMRDMRFVLASALMFDGYYACADDEPHNAAWWLDEFAVNEAGHSVYPAGPEDTQFMSSTGWLGEPEAPAYEWNDPDELLRDVLRNGLGNDADQSVWRRDFAKGIALVNPTGLSKDIILGGSYKKILGELDPTVNDGAEVTSITLNPQSGILLIGPLP